MRAIPFFCVAVLIFTGCQSVREFPAPSPHWKTAQGQLQYTTPQRSVIGEVALSSDGAQNFQLDYLAGPGVPLMRLRMSGDAVKTEGIFGKRPSWVALRDVFVKVGNAKSGTFQSAPGKTQWTATVSGQRVQVKFPRTQERFTFVLMR